MEENKDLELVKELLEKKQYTKLRQMLSDKNTADIAVILEELPEEDLLKISVFCLKQWQQMYFPI